MNNCNERASVQRHATAFATKQRDLDMFTRHIRHVKDLMNTVTSGTVFEFAKLCHQGSVLMTSNTTCNVGGRNLVSFTNQLAF